jgi:hypothetical protein
MRAVCDSKKISSYIEGYKGAVLPLILMDMKDKKLFVRRLPKEKWERHISKHSTQTDWTWLLGYEGIRNGWLSDRKKLMEEALFEALAKRNIVFYNRTKNVKSSRRLKKIQVIVRRRKTDMLAKAIRRLRGFQVPVGSAM